MATYLYECLGEGKHGEFETEHSIKIKLEECPRCQEAGLGSQPVRRLIAAATPGKVELVGQDLVDSIKRGAKDLEKSASKNENLYSNLIGEGKYNQIQTQLDRRRR